MPPIPSGPFLRAPMKQFSFVFVLLCGLTFAQAPQPRVAVKLDPVQAVSAKAGQTVTVSLTAHVDSGFHVNAEKQVDEFLIPLRLTWTPGILESSATTFPKFETVKLAFSEKPVNIYSGDFKIETKFKVSAKAAPGASTVAGKLRFQACNDRECLIPRTLDIVVPVEIVK